mmetsp:Transcript_43926/g.138041  ORF Transcript_43926/g.138041 Transcript_43926/m.138041 type:complete len:672 (+) Transcript_43926:4826-6841(+)
MAEGHARDEVEDGGALVVEAQRRVRAAVGFREGREVLRARALHVLDDADRHGHDAALEQAPARALLERRVQEHRGDADEDVQVAVLGEPLEHGQHALVEHLVAAARRPRDVLHDGRDLPGAVEVEVVGGRAGLEHPDEALVDHALVDGLLLRKVKEGVHRNAPDRRARVRRQVHKGLDDALHVRVRLADHREIVEPVRAELQQRLVVLVDGREGEHDAVLHEAVLGAPQHREVHERHGALPVDVRVARMKRELGERGHALLLHHLRQERLLEAEDAEGVGRREADLLVGLHAEVHERLYRSLLDEQRAVLRVEGPVAEQLDAIELVPAVLLVHQGVRRGLGRLPGALARIGRFLGLVLRRAEKAPAQRGGGLPVRHARQVHHAAHVVRPRAEDVAAVLLAPLRQQTRHVRHRRLPIVRAAVPRAREVACDGVRRVRRDLRLPVGELAPVRRRAVVLGAAALRRHLPLQLRGAALLRRGVGHVDLQVPEVEVRHRHAVADALRRRRGHREVPPVDVLQHLRHGLDLLVLVALLEHLRGRVQDGVGALVRDPRVGVAAAPLGILLERRVPVPAPRERLILPGLELLALVEQALELLPQVVHRRVARLLADLARQPRGLPRPLVPEVHGARGGRLLALAPRASGRVEENARPPATPPSALWVSACAMHAAEAGR